jgi:ferredoxin
VKYGVLVVIGVMAAFGSMTLMVLDPLSLLTRTATTALVPALDLTVTGLQRWLLQWPAFDPIVDWIEATFRGNALPLTQPRFDQAVALFLVFLAIVLLNAFADRFWCRYLCPLGALLAWLSKLQVARPVVGDACTRCGACVRACRVGAIELPAAGGAGEAATARPAHDAACTARGGAPAEIVSSECTMCLDCLVACPEPGAMGFGLLRRPGPVPAYDPGRRHFLAAAGTGLGAVALLGAGVWRTQESPALLRPPGVGAESRFLSLCLRCTECMKVCPTSGLQPALGQAGLEGIWSPVLVPRIGYCDYGCNACGRVCPSGAIPELDLATKREQVIGIAVIDRDRCLPWAQDAPCIVCEEMCPTPQKAIELRGGTGRRPARPVVIPGLCIGCGICETKCPVSGRSAIVVERQAPAAGSPYGEVSGGHGA